MNGFKKHISYCLNTIHNAFTASACFLYQGYRAGRFKNHFMRFGFNIINAVQKYAETLQNETLGYKSINDSNLVEMRNKAVKLHACLPKDPKFTYSILIPVYKPKGHFLHIALKSALEQSAPNFEVLIGYDGPQPEEIYKVVENFKLEYPDRLRVFKLDRETEGGGISSTTNYLAAKAKGGFLVLMDHDDWMRPDLLLRYEQTLRLLDHPENAVLYCDEFKIDEYDYVIPGQRSQKPATPPFPYLFINTVCHCLMIPRHLWEMVGGLRSGCNGAQDFDIVLRLHLSKAQFHLVPYHLYAWRAHAQSTAQNTSAKPYVTEAGIEALNNYCLRKELSWNIKKGYIDTTYRAIPEIKHIPSIQVIIPFEGEDNVTMDAIRSVLRQGGVKVHVTMVIVNDLNIDNSISSEAQKLGVKILKVSENCNFSQKMNLAANNANETQSELLLFLDETIFLQDGALLEMCRWIYQSKVGIVGCRIQDKDGYLHHAGIDINNRGSFYTECGRHFDSAFNAKILRIVDAVSPQCALMNRNVFLNLKGFDEISCTDALNETQLSLKLKSKDLVSLYTPFAVAVLSDGH